MKKLTIIYADDWSGVYLGNELHHEGHRIEPEDILHILNIEYKCLEADYDWLASRGHLPEKLEDVKLEGQKP